jgi:hypothetical protein
MGALAFALFATTLVDASPEELAARADAVVRGTVESVEARRRPGSKRVFTYVRVRVTERLKGGEDAALVRVPGGSADGYTQAVAGAPDFTEGEEVLLFLRKRRGGQYEVERLALGKYALRAGVAARSAGGARVAAPGGKALRALDVLPLEDLLVRIRRGAKR